MNKSKALFLTIVCGLCSTFFATSCLNSDDTGSSTSGLTRADSTECVSQAIGSYTGKIVYTKPSTYSAQSSLDSVDASWKIDAVTSTYGSITMSQFPASILAPYLDSSTTSDSPQAIMESAPAQPLTTWLIPYSKVASTSVTQYGYGITPTQNMEFDVDYNGTTHKVTVKFANYLQMSSSSYYYYPVAIKYGERFEGNILVNTLTIDEQEYKIQTLLYFYGLKS